jgi:hypothetical protein
VPGRSAQRGRPAIELASFEFRPPKFYSQANDKARPLRLHERVKNNEADDNGLDEKEDSVELMIALVSCDRSRRQAGEIKQVTDDVLRP